MRRRWRSWLRSGPSGPEDGNPYPRIPDIEVDERDRSFVYNAAVLLFYGHYWRQEPPVHLEDWTGSPRDRAALSDHLAVCAGRTTTEPSPFRTISTAMSDFSAPT